MALSSLRSSRNATSFWIASSSGTRSPLDCVEGSSRLRMFTVRVDCSWAPTTVVDNE